MPRVLFYDHYTLIFCPLCLSSEYTSTEIRFVWRRQTIVWRRQTIVWCRQTIVWPWQTIVCYQQTISRSNKRHSMTSTEGTECDEDDWLHRRPFAFVGRLLVKRRGKRKRALPANCHLKLNKKISVRSKQGIGAGGGFFGTKGEAIINEDSLSKLYAKPTRRVSSKSVVRRIEVPHLRLRACDEANDRPM